MPSHAQHINFPNPDSSSTRCSPTWAKGCGYGSDGASVGGLSSIMLLILKTTIQSEVNLVSYSKPIDNSLSSFWINFKYTTCLQKRPIEQNSQDIILVL